MRLTGYSLKEGDLGGNSRVEHQTFPFNRIFEYFGAVSSQRQEQAIYKMVLRKV